MLSEVINKTDWEDSNEFLQSWNYGEFLKTVGRNILRIKNDNSEAQCIIKNSKLGIKSAYLPRIELKPDTIEYFKKNNYTFIQVEPTNQSDLSNYNYKYIPNLQTPDTLILDVSKPEAELLEQMHQKTRYNIRLAEKKGVVIKQGKNLDVYWQLHLQTTERDNFASHDKKYIAELLKLDNIYQLNAYKEKKPIAGAILLYHKATLYYFFGASSNEDRNLMAPHLLHWEIIKFTKKLNCKYYDFWGMAQFTDENDKEGECRNGLCWKKDHSFAGVSRFKAGFGGTTKTYPRAVEIILNPYKYRLYKLITLLKTKRIKAGHAK